MENANVDMEKIMEEIRAEIPADRETWNEVRFEDIPMGEDRARALAGEAVTVHPSAVEPFEPEEFDRDVAESARIWQVNFYRPIPGSRIKTFFKRVIRKLIRFCVEPIVQEASAFHGTVVSALDSLRQFVREQIAASRRQQEETARLRRRVEELEKKLEELEKRA